MRNQTGEIERAFEAYRELLERVPGHEPTVAALEELAAGSDAPLRVAAATRLLEEFQKGRPIRRPSSNARGRCHRRRSE